MVIDIILDRRADVNDGQDNWSYSEIKDLYDSAVELGFVELRDILNYGTEEEVKQELCRYIDDQGYRPSIKKFINSVDWLPKDAKLKGTFSRFRNSVHPY